METRQAIETHRTRPARNEPAFSVWKSNAQGNRGATKTLNAKGAEVSVRKRNAARASKRSEDARAVTLPVSKEHLEPKAKMFHGNQLRALPGSHLCSGVKL
jgi:hypothetical protein